jgi:hypothetical protein
MLPVVKQLKGFPEAAGLPVEASVFADMIASCKGQSPSLLLSAAFIKLIFLCGTLKKLNVLKHNPTNPVKKNLSRSPLGSCGSKRQRLGEEVFRQLEGILEMAAAEAL